MKQVDEDGTEAGPQRLPHYCHEPLVGPRGAASWALTGRGRRCAVAGERLPSPLMKKLLVLAVLVALGVVAAKRLRAA